jgi:chromosome segregation ATPase
MSQSPIRQQVAQYLWERGPLEDPTGRATSKLRDVLGYEGSEASFTQLIANMDRAGQLTREVRGKRTYRIAAVADTPAMATDNSRDATDEADVDYDRVASALLVQVVQTLTETGRGKDSGGSWARRRIERLEKRINDLEHDLLQARAESKTLSAERDELRLQLEHSEGNLAVLSEKLSTGKPRDGQLSKLLRTDERALLNHLRENVATARPGRLAETSSR